MPVKQPSFRPSVLVLGALGLALTGACKDDPPTPKLFQEEGAWSVIKYDVDGTGVLDINDSNRRDAFMLSFDSAAQVVTTAACIEREGDTVADSPCLLNPSDTYWACQCFAYDFVRDEMLWREFNPGDIPPDVSLSAVDEPGDGTATAGGGGGGDDTLIALAEIPDINSTYNFRPLPDGVFGSDGVISRFVFQKRSTTVFERAYEDPAGRPGCEPCVP